MIELQDVFKSFKDKRALEGVSLIAQPGKTTVLLGTSGCGKSTILKHMNGLLTPDQGEVFYKSQNLTSWNLGEMRQQIGYLIQDGGLFPHLTGLDNIALVARYLGWAEEKIESRAAELLEMVQLDRPILDQWPRQLSGGQKQRVGLMRALMLNPEVLLLDEPLGALDPITRFDLQKDLKEIFSNLSKTVVLVTHDLNEATYLGDHIVLLKEGKIVQSGAMKDLVESPATDFVRTFVNAQRNLV